MISNAAAPLLALVDTAIIGRLPEPYFLGAVAVGGMIMTFVINALNFLRMSTGGLTAQAAGAQDWPELTAILVRALGLAMIGGCLLILLQQPILTIALTLVDGSENVEQLTGTYFLTRIWASPASLANYVLVGWLLGNGRAMATLAVQIMLNGLNAALSIWFVLGLEWGVFGVAIASVIAEYTAAALGLLLAWKVGAGRWGLLRREVVLRLDRLKKLTTLNANIFLRTTILLVAFSYFTARSASQGDVILAANTVLLQFFMFIGLALDAFADVAEVKVGRTFGASDRDGFIQAVVITGLWSLIVSMAFAGIYAIAGGLIIDTLTTLEDVRARARDFLIWATILPIPAAIAFAFDGVYLGATRADIMRNATAISAAGYLLSIWSMMAIWGNHGLWLAMIVFMILRSLTLGLALPKLYASVTVRGAH